MTDRESPPDPGRDGALTIAARLFGDARHIPKRECLGCGGAGRGRGAVSWQCDGSGPTVSGDWSAEFHAQSEWMYARSMFESGHTTTDPGPQPPKPRTSYDWSYTFSWSQIRERAAALAVGEQTGAFEAVPEAPKPAPATSPAEPMPTPDAPPQPERLDQLSLAL